MVCNGEHKTETQDLNPNLPMTYFLTTGAEQAFSYPISGIIVGVVGFIAAVTLGSLAWYNSKRPPGWEDKERPDIVPDIDTQ